MPYAEKPISPFSSPYQQHISYSSASALDTPNPSPDRSEQRSISPPPGLGVYGCQSSITEPWHAHYSTETSTMYTDPHTSGAFEHPIPQASPCPSLSPYNREMSAFSHEGSEPAYPSVKVESSGWSPQVPYTSVAPVDYTGLPLPSALTTHMHMGASHTMAPVHLHPEAYNYGGMYTSPGPRTSSNASDYGESIRAQSEESSHSIYQVGRVSIATSSTKRAKGRGRRHTDPANGPHRCPHCPTKTFARKYNFDQHMLTHSPDRTKEHPCRFPDCGRGFVRKTDLLRHFQSVHEKARPYQCTRCLKTFARKDTLIRHGEDGCPHARQITYPTARYSFSNQS